MDDRGTYCGIIEKQIATSVCPLPAGRGCMWKHRETGHCTFDPDFAEKLKNPNQFAEKVGLPPVDEEIEAILMNSFRERLKVELQT